MIEPFFKKSVKNNKTNRNSTLFLKYDSRYVYKRQNQE